MPTLFSSAREWLADQMQAAAGVSVTYTRAAGGSALTLAPWVGRTVFKSVGPDAGAYVQWGDRDYLVRRDELTVNGSAVLPALGDRLTEVIDGASVVFEVQQPDTGEAHWRYSGQDRMVYRIHVKRVT